jgi:hypothetical protein
LKNVPLHLTAEEGNLVDEFLEVLLSVRFPEISPVICKYSAGSLRALIISEKTFAEFFGTRVALGLL